MISNLDPAAQQFLNSLDLIQTRLDTAERQLSSGLKVSTPSDAPDQVSPILQLHADIQANQNVQSNLNLVKTQVDTGEQVLSSSVDLLQQASVIATQATGPNQTAQTRATLAGSVESLLDQMVQNSRTTVSGRYIFSGASDQTPLYQVDLSAPNGVDRLAVAASTQQIAGPGGSSFPLALSANDIFDHRNADDSLAPDNVFAALNGLRAALAANDDAGIQNSISALDTASQYMNTELAFYGQTQDRIADGLQQTQTTDTQLRTQLSTRQDADLSQVITELTSAQTQLQATLEARAQIPRISLFDMIPASTT